MREYMKNLGSVMMMTALANTLMPEGSMKKFAALAMGFMLITAAISVIPKGAENISFSAESFEISEDEISETQAQYRARVITKHRENLQGMIEEKMEHGSSAFVETDNSGELTAVTLRIRGDESAAIAYVVDELKFPRERIKIINEKN